MVTDDDYRDCAAKALNLAQAATDPTDRARLLAIAEAWLELADRRHGRGGRIRR
jgi:hypothetical protein